MRWMIGPDSAMRAGKDRQPDHRHDVHADLHQAARARGIAGLDRRQHGEERPHDGRRQEHQRAEELYAEPYSPVSLAPAICKQQYRVDLVVDGDHHRRHAERYRLSQQLAPQAQPGSPRDMRRARRLTAICRAAMKNSSSVLARAKATTEALVRCKRQHGSQPQEALQHGERQPDAGAQARLEDGQQRGRASWRASARS